MDSVTKLFWVVVAGFVIFGAVSLSTAYAWTSEKIEYIYEYYPIYRCTAPFGVLSLEISGSGSFILASGSFSIEGGLSEKYVVKYWDGDELKTQILSAESTSVIVDDTFQLELMYWQEVQYHKETGRRRVNGDSMTNDIDGEVEDYWHEWLIHIPLLPPPNETITTEWIK